MIIIHSQDADQTDADEGKGDVHLCSVQTGTIKVIIHVIKIYQIHKNDKKSKQQSLNLIIALGRIEFFYFFGEGG